MGRVVLWDHDEVNDALWMPLIVFLARAKDEDVYPALLWELDFRDFMLMHGVERKPRPFLYVYKHTESRREVNLDADGSPYRFLPAGESGQYRATSFSRAVWALDPLFIRQARRRRAGVEPAWAPDDDWTPDDWAAGRDEPPVAPTRHLRVVR